jgi:hypothetical protein
MNGPDDPDSTGTDAPTFTRRRTLALAGTAAAGAVGFGSTSVLGRGDDTDDGEARTFTVRLENVSTGTTLRTTADGEAAEQPVPVSPVAWAVHTRDEPIFSAGKPERDNGLEEVAEDGSPMRLVRKLKRRETVVAAGALAVPVGDEGPGPLLPGNAYEGTLEAESGAPRLYLSLVTMFIPSNDIFYTLGGASGVPLFRSDGEGAAPMAGDVTERLELWDAGTEINEEPGVGENQAQRQRGTNVGLVERGTVAPIADVNGYDYPAVEDVVKLTITPHDGSTDDDGSIDG